MEWNWRGHTERGKARDSTLKWNSINRADSFLLVDCTTVMWNIKLNTCFVSYGICGTHELPFNVCFCSIDLTHLPVRSLFHSAWLCRQARITFSIALHQWRFCHTQNLTPYYQILWIHFQWRTGILRKKLRRSSRLLDNRTKYEIKNIVVKCLGF